MKILISFCVFLVSLPNLCLSDSTCRDISPWASCQAWLNLCDTYIGNFYCKKTCNRCGGNTPAPPSSKPTTATQSTYKPSPGGGNCGVSLTMKGKIVNGENAQKGAWPWIASLQKSSSHFCGGTLIDTKWVLTACHCVEQINSWNMGSYKVVLGAHDFFYKDGSEQTIGIKRVIRHPSYSKTTLMADFALLELANPAMLDNRVQLACLPNGANNPPRTGKQCYLAGWGSIKHPGRPHNLLQQVELPVVDSTLCKHNSEVVCVGKGYGRHSNGQQQPNACRGDSGGPLVCKNDNNVWILEGAASYVVEYCKYYTGYSPVHKYYSWITSNMN